MVYLKNKHCDTYLSVIRDRTVRLAAMDTASDDPAGRKGYAWNILADPNGTPNVQFDTEFATPAPANLQSFTRQVELWIEWDANLPNKGLEDWRLTDSGVVPVQLSKDGERGTGQNWKLISKGLHPFLA